MFSRQVNHKGNASIIVQLSHCPRGDPSLAFAEPLMTPRSILPAEDLEAISRQAAHHIQAALTLKPALLLCAAGGITPLRTYELLAAHRTHKPEAFQSLRVVKLDEWGGLEMNDPGSCEGQLR